MRIITGKYKGRKFPELKNFTGRATTDFAKTGLFNILNNYYDFEQISVLDLFAGSGNISFECASRGCLHIDAVEQNQVHVSYIYKLIEILEEKNIHVFRTNAFQYLNRCTKKYDVIFADPPYIEENLEDVYNPVFQRELLKDGGMLIIEHSKRRDLSALEHFKETRNYGNVYFSVFCR